MDTSLQFSGYDFKRTEAVEVDYVVNNREIPCDGCKLEDSCAERSMICRAFRSWANTGDFKDIDVARHIRLERK